MATTTETATPRRRFLPLGTDSINDLVYLATIPLQRLGLSQETALVAAGVLLVLLAALVPVALYLR